MKKMIVLLLTILITKIVSGQICDGQQVVLTQDGQCDYNPWVIVFEDNFDGNSLDLSKWKLPYQGVLNDFNHEHSKWWMANTGNTPSIPVNNNIEVSNGTLKLIAKKENPPITGTYVTDWSTTPPTTKTEIFDYSSAWIETNYKFFYGKYEIRCKIPNGKGFWPAFWMYGVNSSNSSINNEIDVFEFWDNSPSDHNMTVHYNGQQCLTDYNGPDYSQAFHTFTVIWDNYKIEWYVDGNLKRRSTKFYTILGQTVDCNGIQAMGTYLMDKVFPRDPMNIITNLAIQTGTYAPDNNTTFPNSLEIDYIRYYKQIPCAGEVTATDITQLNLSNDIYNFIIGTTITVGGNVTIQNGQQLELVARDEIGLLLGFTAEAGSNFVARIDPTICAGINKMASTDRTTKDSVTSFSEVSQSNALTTQVDKNYKIKTYPNPNNGIFSVEFDGGPLQEYELYLIDGTGKVVYSLKSIKNNKVDIDMTGFGKGNYIITVLDTKNKNAFVNKIIYN